MLPHETSQKISETLADIGKAIDQILSRQQAQGTIIEDNLVALVTALNRQVDLLGARSEEGGSHHPGLVANRLAALIEGSDNQSALLNSKLSALVEGLNNQSALLDVKLSALVEASANQSALLDAKLSALVRDAVDAKLAALIEAAANQSALLDVKLSTLIEGSDNQSVLLDAKLSALIENSVDAKLAALIEGSDNQSALLDGKLSALLEAADNQSALLNAKLSTLIEGSDNQSALLNGKLSALLQGSDNQSALLNAKLSALVEAFDNHLTALLDSVGRLPAALEGSPAQAHDAPAPEGDRPALRQRRSELLRLLLRADVAASAGGARGEITGDCALPSGTVSAPEARRGPDTAAPPPPASTVYVCHIEHDDDRTYTENVSEYLQASGIPHRIVEINHSGQRPELQRCLDEQPALIIGYNSQLDHSWLHTGSFMTAAAERGTPVIQWILDHPASRWAEFFMSTAENSRFLFNSHYSEQYFLKYCLPNARTATMGGVGPSARSRVTKLSRAGFLSRAANCVIPLSLRQIVGGPDEIKRKIGALPPVLAHAVNTAADAARYDLDGPLELHLVASLQEQGAVISNDEFNFCMSLVQAAVQVFRRLRIFEIARGFRVVIQSDAMAKSVVDVEGAAADWAENVRMSETLSRMPTYRAVLSVSPLNDMIHDRTMNALNAGCVAIVEDSAAHRASFEDRRNALFFRYDDDSLRDCLDLVCNRPRDAFECAREGFSLRDSPVFRYGGFRNIVELAWE